MVTLTYHIFFDAITNLSQAIEFAKKHQSLGEEDYYKQFRAAAIQAFEYTYDIGQKLIRRHVEAVDITEENSRDLDYRDYMRVAAEYGLLNDPEEWVEFRAWRNETSHSYDAEIAESLFQILPSAVISMRYTCEQLEKRNAS